MESGTLERRAGSGRSSFERDDRTKKVVNCIREKRNRSIRDIAELTKIPKTTVHDIITDKEMRSIPRR